MERRMFVRMYAVVFAIKLCGSVCVFFYNTIAMRKSSSLRKKATNHQVLSHAKHPWRFLISTTNRRCLGDMVFKWVVICDI